MKFTSCCGAYCVVGEEWEGWKGMGRGGGMGGMEGKGG